MFPDRLTTEITYKLTGEWGNLFGDVLEYARELVLRTEGQALMQQRMSWWAALALLRCISSSPAAAVNALRTRLNGTSIGDTATGEQELTLEEAEEQGRERVLDGVEDNLSIQDIEPGARTEDSEWLSDLIVRAEGLAGGAKDPKLKKLVEHLKELTEAGFQPVVFCRYIATAHYVAEQLRSVFKSHQVTPITGDFAPAEREAMVEAMGDAEKRILVATDCLSEGINLQNLFTAVVHYDLSWNPTRHEQREGRVDRFGQKSPQVRTTMLFGQDNPVDGAVLQVILRKAESIRKELGVMVPMPDDDGKLTQALVGAVLLRKGTTSARMPQMGLDFGEPEIAIETAWQSAREKASKNRTLFAQRRLKPEDVLPEWQKTLAVLGGEEDVERFVKRASVQLGAPLEVISKAGATHWKLHSDSLPLAVRERLEGQGIVGTQRIDFHQPAAPSSKFIHRTHPLVSVLADYLLEVALDNEGVEGSTLDAVARAGAIFTNAVNTRTTVMLVRLRHQLTVTHRGNSRLLLCEETVAIGVDSSQSQTIVDDATARALMAAEPERNMPTPLRDQNIQRAIDSLDDHKPVLEALARKRSELLLEDHRRVREAAQGRGEYRVTPSLPVDVMGVFVLIPA